jgi:4-amino-4-deoxy-L-arabinose transferase-like glycosyltransferase
MRIEGSERDAAARLTWLARARSWRWAGASLVALCVAVYVPGLASLPPVDRDESRFAQASRQMFEAAALPEAQRDPALHAGGVVVPMVQDRPRLNKPPLIYWLQAGSAAVLTGGDPARDAIWMYRVPSVLAAIAAVLMTWRLGVRMFDPRAAWLAGALLAVAPVMVWESRQARADMVLVAATTLAMSGLYRVWRAGRGGGTAWVGAAMLWTGVALGVLVKGPITPMVCVLAAVGVCVASRRWRWLGSARPVLGVLLVGACVGPWVYGVARHVGFERYYGIVHDEVLGRSMEPKEGHWGPPGYHLVLLCVLFWPGTLVTALAVRRAIGFVRRRSARAPEVFLLAWIVPSWVVFELVSTKLPHYTMPLYPAIALLSARAVFAAASGRLTGVREVMTKVGFGLWIGIGAAVSLAGVAAVAWPYRDHLGIAIPVAGVVGVVVVLSLARSRRALAREDLVLAQVRSVLLAAFVGVCIVGLGLPRNADLWISPRVVRAAAEMGSNRPLAAVGFHEDSLVFATRGRVAKIDPPQVDQWLRDHPRGIVVAQASAWDALGPLVAWIAEPTSNAPVTVEGFNYSQGKRVVLRFGERAPGKASP